MSGRHWLSAIGVILLLPVNIHAGREETQAALVLDQAAAQALTLHQNQNKAQLGQPIPNAAYLRRASLILLGRNPTASEAAEFLATPDRPALIQRMVDAPEFAQQEFRAWITRLGLDPEPTSPPQAWLLSALEKKLPYPAWSAEWIGKWTPELVVRRRDSAIDGARGVKWLEAFVGKNLDCARCHDHAFASTTISQVHGLLAFLGDRGTITMFEVPQPPGQTVFASTGELEPVLELYRSKRDREALKPGAEWPDVDSAAAFATWLHDPKNPLGRARAVDRVWERMTGYEWFADLEDPLQMKDRPPHLRHLYAAALKIYEAMDQDDRRFTQVLANSSLFGLGTSPWSWDTVGLLGPPPRRLTADQLERTVTILETGSIESPIGLSLDSAVPLDPPVWLRTADLERRLFTAGAAWKKDLESAPTDEAKIGRLYLAVLSRQPSEEENQTLRNAIGEGPERFETALWALLMSEEFVWMP